jgi:hypothetical protein
MTSRAPTELVALLRRYAAARAELLADLGLPRSNRDPLAEFSEGFVAALLGGGLAPSRVQRSYDLLDARARRVQVRYLANPADTWVNEHLVTFTEDLDAYALVAFENLDPIGVVVFPRDSLEQVGINLGKRHPNQATTLQLTPRNWLGLVDRAAEFARLGVELFLPPGWSAQQAE